MGVITCVDVKKRYGSFAAIQIDELTVHTNTITGVIGRNGAGKTTLLELIAGILKTNEGDLRVFGEQPFDNLLVSANTIFIDDQMVFPQSFTLGEILSEMGNFYPNWDARLAKRLMAHFELSGKSFHSDLSKGKKSTFNMIVGLATHAALTIFDEPTTGMDVAVRKDFYRALLRDYVAHPRTILISSHHLNEIENLLENLVLIDQGKVVLHETLDELREYATQVTGPEVVVAKWAESYHVLHQERVGLSDLAVVVRGEVADSEVQRIGAKKSPVSPTDVVIYITNMKKGGIDDVFDN